MACRLFSGCCQFAKRQLKCKAPKVFEHSLLNSCCRSVSSTSSPWQLWSAVCLERPPVITQEVNDIEKEYQQMLHEIENENSYLSLHEIHHRTDKEEAVRLSQAEELSEADAARQTALDLEDIWDSHLSKFTPAHRITDADKENNQKSLQRKLDQKLLLVVKQKLGSQSHWGFPQRERTEGESMRQTAESALSMTSAEFISERFLGNVPCGFYKYKLPTSVQQETNKLGVKLFFFRALLDDTRDIKMKDDNIEDFMWLTKNELKSYLSPAYYKQVKDFISEL